jgi:mono/diheme cytochrome c family protein
MGSGSSDMRMPMMPHARRLLGYPLDRHIRRERQAMKLVVCILAGVVVLTTGAIGQVRRDGVADRVADGGAGQARKMLDTYCVGCHNSRAKAGDLALDVVSMDAVRETADVWEKAIRKLRGRLMPPPTSRQPEQREIDAFVEWMEARLDAAADRPLAGHVPAQRLSRTEFATSVDDLLGIELDATQILPSEIEVNGFENIATALTVSPAFLDQYVAAARVAAKLAVGDATKVTSATYLLPPGEQPDHVDGLPLGTRGGMKFRHNFPADGEYRFTILDLGIDLYSRVLDTRHRVVILVDGREVFRGELGGTDDLRTVDRKGAPGRAEVTSRFANLPVPVKAGIHDVAVTFIERARVESDEFVGVLPGDEFSRGDREPRLVSGVKVDGPFNSPGVSETPSRRKIFVCRPDRQTPERTCARRIAATLARGAFRRPVTEADVDGLMPFFDKGRASSFDAGIEQLIAAVLVSPEFLYRTIHLPAAVPAGAIRRTTTSPAAAPAAYPLTDLELASRLSFFLWSQGPDETLLAIAASGKLGVPGALQRQVQRMLKDPRASRLVRNFAMRALDLDKLDQVVPDPNLFPSFSDALRRDMSTEIELFLSSILLEDRDVGDLLSADHTFLNDRLAKHYGIPSVSGPQFRRVTLDDPRRWGLMGKGAVLLRTSYGDRTSPVLRGAWVLGKLMGTPPTPPPPDVDTDLSQAKGEAPKTLRARLEQHRSKPGCNQCHGVIDPIGLALENFDAVGRWREVDREANAPIDARTVLPNGMRVNGPAELRAALFGGRDLFVRAFTEKLMMYALGRELQAYDMPQVRAVVRRAATQGNRLSAIVSGIVSSDAFRMQAAPADAGQVSRRD